MEILESAGLKMGALYQRSMSNVCVYFFDGTPPESVEDFPADKPLITTKLLSSAKAFVHLNGLTFSSLLNPTTKRLDHKLVGPVGYISPTTTSYGTNSSEDAGEGKYHLVPDYFDILRPSAPEAFAVSSPYATQLVKFPTLQRPVSLFTDQTYEWATTSTCTCEYGYEEPVEVEQVAITIAHTYTTTADYSTVSSISFEYWSEDTEEWIDIPCKYKARKYISHRNYYPVDRSIQRTIETTLTVTEGSITAKKFRVSNIEKQVNPYGGYYKVLSGTSLIGPNKPVAKPRYTPTWAIVLPNYLHTYVAGPKKEFAAFMMTVGNINSNKEIVLSQNDFGEYDIPEIVGFTLPIGEDTNVL